MKLNRYVAFSLLLTLATLSGIIYSACTKDACKTITCLNKGTCSGGGCKCLTGIGGNRCETVFINEYVHTYLGTTTTDTVYTYPGSSLELEKVSDTDFVNMKMHWKDSANMLMADLPVVLNSFSSSGTLFSVMDTSSIIKYTGTGTITENSISMDLKAVSPVGTRHYLFNNFARKK